MENKYFPLLPILKLKVKLKYFADPQCIEFILIFFKYFLSQRFMSKNSLIIKKHKK